MIQKTTFTISIFLGLIFAGSCGLAQGNSWKSQGNGTKTWGNGNSWKDETDNTGVPEEVDVASVEAGELEIESNQGIGYLHIAGGNLKGKNGATTDSLEIRGQSAHSTWYNGSIRRLNLLIASGAFFDVYNSTVNDFEGSLIENSGTLTWTEGNLTTDSAGGITNMTGALFADQTIGSVTIGANGATFHNYGTYAKTGPGTTTVTQAFNNYSANTLEVFDGIFVLNGGGTNIDGAVMRAANSGLIKFSSNYTIVNAANLEVGSVTNENALNGTHFFFLPQSEETVDYGYELAAGTLSLGSIEQSALNVALFQSGGTLGGTHVLASDYFLSAGDLNSTGTTTIADGGRLILANSVTNDFDGRTIEILTGGTVEWAAGNLRSGSGGLIENYGEFNDTNADSESTSSINSNFGGPLLVFNNHASGAYNKRGQGTTNLGVAFNNDGELNVYSGTLSFNQGGTNSLTGTIFANEVTNVIFNSNYTVSDAANLSGPGQFALTSGILTFNGDFSGTNFEIEGGTLAGDQTFTNGLTWTGGNLSSPGVTTNDVQSEFFISNASGNLLTGREIINLGTINWTAGDIILNTGSEITNDGEFNDNAAAKIRTSSGTLGVFHNNSDAAYTVNHQGTTEFDITFENNGTLTLSGGNVKFDGGGSNSTTGVITAQTGTNVTFNSDFAVANASNLEGTGQFALTAGTLTLDGNFRGSDFEIAGGALSGTHSFQGGAIWTGGILRDGSTTNDPEAGFIINDPSGNEIINHTFINDGNVQWMAGDIIANTGSIFYNQANLEDSADAIFRTSSGTVAIFNNSLTGSYLKLGSGTTKFTTIFNNDGSVNVEAGSLILDGNGTTSSTGSFDVSSTASLVFDHDYTVIDAALLTGLGTYRLAQGNLILDGVFGGNAFEITGGTLNGDQTFTSGVSWTGGTLGSGLTTIGGEAVFTINNPSAGVVTSRNINTLGTIDWNAADLILNTGSILANNGTFNDQADAKIRTTSGTKGVFNNNNGATYNKNGTGTSELQVTFNNTDGTLNVNAGTLVLNGGGVSNAGATINVASTAALEFKSSYNIADAAGLQGAGEYKLSAGTLTLTGEVGASDFLFAGGTLGGNQTFINGLNWTNGSFASGTTTNASNSTFTIDILSGSVLSDRDVDNLGAVEWLSGDVILNTGSVFTNNGTFNDSADARVRTTSGLTGVFTIGAGGTYHKDGSATTEFDLEFNNNGGLVNVNAGTLILDGGGITSTTGRFEVAAGAVLQFDHNYTINDASKLAGTGEIKATGGTFELLNQVSNAAITIDGATLVGNQSFHQGMTLLSGGLGSGQTTVSNNSFLNLSAPAGNTLAGREIYIQPGSTLNWTTGNINANTGSLIFLQGSLYDTAGARFATTSGTAGSLTIFGAYHKNGTGTTEFRNLFNNYGTGTVNVNSGSLVLDGGGAAGASASFNVASTAELEFSQNYEIADAASLQGLGIYRLTAGALEITGDLSANFNFEGGSMFGLHDIHGLLTWSGGVWTTGSSQIGSEVGHLLIEGSSNTFNARNVTNAGTTDWNHGAIFLNTGSAFTNSGLFNDKAADGETTFQVSTNSGTAGSFTNSLLGNYIKSSSGETRFNLDFTNAGSLHVSDGTLGLAGGGEFQAGSDIVVSGAGQIRFDDDFVIADAADLSDDEIETGAGFALANGELTLTGTLGAHLVQSGGELTGDHQIAGELIWNGGLWQNGLTTIASTGVVGLGGDAHLLNNRSVNNGGTVNWNEGNLTLNQGSTISNTQTWYGNSTGLEGSAYIYSNTPSTSSFTNSGTYHKNGTGSTHIQVPFYNSGIINLNAGSLSLEQGGSVGATAQINTLSDTNIRFFGSFDIADAASLRGDGVFVGIEGTMNLQGIFSGRQFYAVRSNLIGNHDFETFGFMEDSIWGAGNTEIGSTAIFNLYGHRGETGSILVGRSVTNRGTFNLFFGDLLLNAASSITNIGIFNDMAFGTALNSRVYTSSGTAGTFQNQSGGTYVKQGTDVTTFELALDNAGTILVQSGTLKLQVGGFTGPSGTINIGTGAVFELASDYAIDEATVVTGGGTLKLSAGTLEAAGEIGSRFEMSGGVLDGDLDFSRTFAIQGGSIAASSTISLVGEASGLLNSGSLLTLDATTMSVGSGASLSWQSGDIDLTNNSSIRVDGLLDMTGDFSLTQSGGSTALFDVSGTFRKIAGEETNTFEIPAEMQGDTVGGSSVGTAWFGVPVDVSGRFEIHQGSAELSQGGTSTGGLFGIWTDAHLEISNGYTFNEGTSFGNAGSLDLSGGDFVLNGNVNLGPQASVTGGEVTGTHTLGGTIHWTGAALDASGITTIANGAHFILDIPGEVDLLRSLQVNGNLEWRSGNIHGGNGTLVNDGRVEVSNDGSFDNANAGTYSIINNGQFVKTGNEGTTTIDVPFTNNGLVHAEEGLIHFTDTFTFNSGGKLGGGIKFDAPLALPESSTLGGNGTIVGNISTGGLVAPGNSIGSLNIDGDLTFQPSTVSFFEIDVTAVPSPVDFLSVTGTLALNGILTSEFLNSVMPGVTDNFTIITAGNLTGAFANIQNGDRIHSAGFFQSWVVNYGPSSPFNPNSVVFSSFEFSPVPEPSTFSLLLLGVGFVFWQSRRRRT